MQQYYGTKSLNAKPMTRGEYNAFRGWEIPANENPDDAGYLVEYLDGGKPNHPDFTGYISWSPADVFEKAYQPTDALSFGHALVALEEGKKVARAGWNGKGMFVYLVPAASYPAETEAAKTYWADKQPLTEENTVAPIMVPYGAYFALKSAQDIVNTWVPSISDALADDWQIIE